MEITKVVKHVQSCTCTVCCDVIYIYIYIHIWKGFYICYKQYWEGYFGNVIGYRLQVILLKIEKVVYIFNYLIKVM